MSDYCTYYVTCMYIYGSRSTSFIQLSHTSQKGLDDACVDTVWHCCLKYHQKRTQLYGPHSYYKVSYTLQEEDQFLCNISLRLIVPCFSIVKDCIIIQEVLYFVILSRRKIRNISLRFIVSHYFTWLWAAI